MTTTSDSSTGPPDFTGLRPWWRRPASWIAGIVVAALAATLTGALTGVFGNWLDRATETGPAVSVDSVSTYRSDATGRSTVFAAGTPFTSADLDELNQSEDDVAWLEGRGGVPVQSVYIQLVLSGSRSDPVRITEIGVSPTCRAPLDGLLFENPPAGADDSISVFFDLDDADPVAMLLRDDGTAEPYFPARTLSLAKGEQQVVLVTASTNESSCTFTLDLTVLERDETRVQKVSMPNGSPFAVTASVPDREYEDVYLGGVICSTWVKAGTAYFEGDSENYCSG